MKTPNQDPNVAPLSTAIAYTFKFTVIMVRRNKAVKQRSKT